MTFPQGSRPAFLLRWWQGGPWIPAGLLLLLVTGVGQPCPVVAAPAPLGGQEPVTVRSTSGQFTVRGLPLGPPVGGRGTSEVSYLRLDPTLTAVSLERIRHALGSELGLTEGWKGPINVQTFPVVTDDPMVTVTSVKFANGWGYRVEMPEVVDKPRFIRTVVTVLLLEFAHRTALAREVELPPWLADGLAAQLEATALAGLALEPGTAMVGNAARPDPLRRVREVLRERGVLNFDQLSHPGTGGVDPAHYAAAAQLFVHELLRLRGGPDKLRDLLVRLPRHLNWQTAFLGAYAADFPRLLDVDKWWLLVAMHQAGREVRTQWAVGAALAQLEEVLGTAVEVRTGPGALPIQTSIPLPRMLGEWEFARQAPVLEAKVARLEALLPRSPPEVALLVANYRQVLQGYLRQRAKPALETKITPAVNPRLLVHETLRTLEELDRRRDALRPSGTVPVDRGGGSPVAP
ncbi:MAG: hypothetical protein RJA22_758 [Verrucomicrobiota bacterium]